MIRAQDVEQHFVAALALVQVATGVQTFVIDPLAVGDLSSLRTVFGDRGVVKLIHNAAFERRVLGSVGIDLTGVYDTMQASRRVQTTAGARVGVRLGRALSISSPSRRQATHGLPHPRAHWVAGPGSIERLN